MTDNYGTEPPDNESGHDAGHDEILTPEHEAVHEPPSEYEFADDHSDEHGAAAATEEEHAEDMGALPADDAPPARRSPILPIVAAAGGVLLLGVVAWWQFSGPSSSPPPAAPMAAMAPIPVAPAAAPAAPVAAVSSVPVSTVAAKTAATPAQVAPALAQPTAVAAPVATYAPVAQQLVQQQAASNAAEDQRISTLTTRIDDLQKALDQATQQLGQVTNMVASTAGGTSPGSKDLQDRLDRLELQIAQMNHPAPVLTTPATLATETPVTASAPRPVRSFAVHHAAPRTHKVKTLVIEKPLAPASDQWVLRAAAPGQAWVANSSTSRDLKALHVGDTLPGIGRVTAIKEQDGAWSVQGTKGSIQ
jgi:intracellular multiplication protein IcmG